MFQAVNASAFQLRAPWLDVYKRQIHYFMMFVFIIFTMLHGYLVFIEGTANANLMFFGKEHGGLVYDPNRHVIVGEDVYKRQLFTQGASHPAIQAAFASCENSPVAE